MHVFAIVGFFFFFLFSDTCHSSSPFFCSFLFIQIFSFFSSYLKKKKKEKAKSIYSFRSCWLSTTLQFSFILLYFAFASSYFQIDGKRAWKKKVKFEEKEKNLIQFYFSFVSFTLIQFPCFPNRIQSIYVHPIFPFFFLLFESCNILCTWNGVIGEWIGHFLVQKWYYLTRGLWSELSIDVAK